MEGRRAGWVVVVVVVVMGVGRGGMVGRRGMGRRSGRRWCFGCCFLGCWGGLLCRRSRLVLTILRGLEVVVVVVGVGDRAGEAEAVVVEVEVAVAMIRRRRIPVRDRSRHRRRPVGGGLLGFGLVWRAVRRRDMRLAATADSGAIPGTTALAILDPLPGLPLVPGATVGALQPQAAQGPAHARRAPATDRPVAVEGRQRKIKTV
jgi:hypothetical protein